MKIGIFQYEHLGSTVRISNARWLPADAPQDPLGLGSAGREIAITGPRKDAIAGRRQAQAWLKAELDRCDRDPQPEEDWPQAVLLLDAAGIDALKDWSALGVFALLEVGLATRCSKRVRREAPAPNEATGFPLPWIYPDNPGLVGFITPAGVVRTVTVKWGGNVGEGGWAVVPATIREEWSGPAPDRMMTSLRGIAREAKDGIGIWSLSLRMFWNLVVPAMEDPFLRQQRLWIGGVNPIEDMMGEYGQPAPRLSFGKGTEEEFVRLLKNVFCASATMQELVSGVLGVFGALEAKIIAAGPRAPARFVGIDFSQASEPCSALIDKICAIMRPTAVELSGSFRVSKARRRRATVNCLLRAKDMMDLTAHQRIARISELVDFLVDNGVPADEAVNLVDAI